MVNIFCVNTGTSRQFTEGVTLLDVLNAFSDSIDNADKILAAKVNNVCQGLKYRAFNSRRVEFVDYSSYMGRSVYCSSLCFLLCKAVKDVFPESRVILRRPISKGYYCTIAKPDGTELTTADVDAISCRMQEIVDSDIPFRRHEVPTDDAVGMFESLGYDDKVSLLKTAGDLYVNYYTLEDTPDYYYEALVPSTGYLKVWNISLYRNGLLLRVPDRHNPQELAPFFEQPKTFEVFSEYLRWNKIMGLDNVGDVNLACERGEANDLIRIAEALQEKKIIKIADAVCGRGKVKLALIAGPSSSGKTTFSKRLSVQLAINGIHPIPLSMDNYFVPRTQTPRDENGEYDFESIYAVDLELFNKQVNQLMNGEEVEIPYYNFETGEREYRGEKLKLGANGMLVIEGIHALNPMLTEKIDKNKIFRIYVSALTTISVDNHNWIPTTDNRLLRRIIRDYKYRGYSAIETISRWAKVMEGEQKWIFPYQENADMTFNSALISELCVLKKFVQPLLSNVPENSPVYQEVSRLKNFLNQFSVVHEEEIPLTSLLREFLGGSTFNY